MRSQERLEQGLKEHHLHNEELSKIRERAHLPQSSRKPHKS